MALKSGWKLVTHRRKAGGPVPEFPKSSNWLVSSRITGSGRESRRKVTDPDLVLLPEMFHIKVTGSFRSHGLRLLAFGLFMMQQRFLRRIRIKLYFYPHACDLPQITCQPLPEMPFPGRKERKASHS